LNSLKRKIDDKLSNEKETKKTKPSIPIVEEKPIASKNEDKPKVIF